MFEDVSLVEPDSNTGPDDERDDVWYEERDVAVCSRLVCCLTVLASFPAGTQACSGATLGLQPPLLGRLNVRCGAPVPEEVRDVQWRGPGWPESGLLFWTLSLSLSQQTQELLLLLLLHNVLLSGDVTGQVHPAVHPGGSLGHFVTIDRIVTF